MNKRQIICDLFEHKRPPYVPWHFTFTVPARAKLLEHYGSTEAMDQALDNHLNVVGYDFGFHEDIGNDRTRDNFGVVWDRTVDKDIGTPEGLVLAEPTLAGYQMPDPLDKRYFDDLQEKIDEFPDRFRVYSVGFALFERAWTLRGMENTLTDFYINPDFARKLLTELTDWVIEHVKGALEFDIDCVRFGDDWGQQHGLIMGPKCWKEFIYPQLKRLYKFVHDADKYVMIHCCGDVDELFDELVEIGLNCFNPFQPEVMDVWSLLPEYRDRLSFYGGLSLQDVLPHGTAEEVTDVAGRLLKLGADGGYIFSPSHDVPGDVPLENILAFIKAAQSQPGYRK